jgi:adenosylcobinamide amidohydrolase
MSSAVLNGGLVYADHLVNLKVQKCLTVPSSPQLTLAKYWEDSHRDGNNFGMMTAASVGSFRMTKESV